MYYNGIGREIDYKNVIKYFNKAIKEYQKKGIKVDNSFYYNENDVTND